METEHLFMKSKNFNVFIRLKEISRPWEKLIGILNSELQKLENFASMHRIRHQIKLNTSVCGFMFNLRLPKITYFTIYNLIPHFCARCMPKKLLITVPITLPPFMGLVVLVVDVILVTSFFLGLVLLILSQSSLNLPRSPQALLLTGFRTKFLNLKDKSIWEKVN